MEPQAADKVKRKKKKKNFRFNKDGSPLEVLTEESKAALSASIMSLSEQAIKELNVGELKRILIEGDDGFLILSKDGQKITKVLLF
jgi:predicted regulator of Ras-like GTPase activity (Roadblock/LC7/MglB family)